MTTIYDALCAHLQSGQHPSSTKLASIHPLVRQLRTEFELADVELVDSIPIITPRSIVLFNRIARGPPATGFKKPKA